LIGHSALKQPDRVELRGHWDLTHGALPNTFSLS
jgi:hypothetical protein